MKSWELSIKYFYCVFEPTEMNLIAFLGSNNCVNMQYPALSGALLSSFVPNFRILSQVVAEKSLTEKMSIMYYIRVTEGKIEKRGQMRISIIIFIYTIQFAYLKVHTKFENTVSNRSWEICDRNFHWKKENEQIKGLISNMWLLLCYTIHLITIKLCTKYQNHKSSSCWEIFDRKKFSDRQTNKQQTEKQNYRKGKNYIPLYTSYRGYKHCFHFKTFLHDNALWHLWKTFKKYNGKSSICYLGANAPFSIIFSKVFKNLLIFFFF